jgi:hypothetical protein
MSFSHIVMPLAAALLGVGCTAVSPPVPVEGDVAALAGEWTGEYWSAESGRRGELVFTLQAGADTARGEVVMRPAPLGRGAAGEVPDTRAGPEAMPQGLSITFVRVSRGVVSGRLDPYRDPECGCRLTTTFLGRLSGDTLSGTFTSRHEEMQRTVEGQWRAVRKR